MATAETGNPPPSKEIKLPSESEMAAMSHSDLYNLRAKVKDSAQQETVSNYEHRAFAREYVEENPVSGTIGLTGAIPAYQTGKALGVIESRTGASLEQAKQAAIGVGEGLTNALKKPWERVWSKVEQAAPETAAAVSKAVGKKPWEMDWASRAGGFNATRPTPKAMGTPLKNSKRNAAEEQMAKDVIISADPDAAPYLSEKDVAEIKKEMSRPDRTPEQLAILQQELDRVQNYITDLPTNRRQKPGNK